MKLITFNQLVSSLETTKEYIDKAVGNMGTGSNNDSHLFVTLAYEEIQGEAVPVLSSHSSTEIIAAIAEGKNVIIDRTQCTVFEASSGKVVVSLLGSYSDIAVHTNSILTIDADKSVETQSQRVYNADYIDYLEAVINTKADSGSPSFTSSVSMGRKSGTSTGSNSVALGGEVTASGGYSHAEGLEATASGEASHAEGAYTTAEGDHSHAEGESTTASERCSHAEGNITEASGEASHAEGFEAIASGDYSHAEGESTTASGISSHAEGNSTTASEYCSHAEGGSTTASGYYSHAEGSRTEASNYYSHAEGANTIASGEGSHAEGYGTIASSEYQHAQGRYNVEDSAEKYAHIVGNGTDNNARSNAYVLEWNGNAWFAGNVSIGDDNRRLATEKYVTDYVSKSSASNYTNTYAWIDSGGLTNVGYGILFQDGTSDSYAGNVCSIYADNSTDPYGHQFNVLGHWCVLDVNMFFDVGSTDNYWRSGYFSEGIFQPSDRSIKENIKYIRNNDVSMVSEDETRKTNLTYNELYNFVKNDLELTTFNFNNSEYQHLGFIAQDLLYNADGTDNKVGQFILPPTTALTEDEIEENISKYKKKVNRELTENEKKALSTPKLTYSNTDYISVLAGALKEAINKIESQQSIIDDLMTRLNKIENQ